MQEVGRSFIVELKALAREPYFITEPLPGAPHSAAITKESLMMNAHPPTGRLILVAETTLSPDSLAVLRQLLQTLLATPDVTMVTGLTRASAVKARIAGKHVFYNMTDHISPEDACAMMPWREIWVVSGGRIWRADGPLARQQPTAAA